MFGSGKTSPGDRQLTRHDGDKIDPMRAEKITIALAQTAPELGDIAENARRAAATVAEAARRGARLLLFPELSLTKYDLACLADPAAWVTIDDPRIDVVRQASRVHGVTTVVGAALRLPDGGARLASLALSPGGGVEVTQKRFLHGAERDLFQPGEPAAHLRIDGWQIALAVCYDAAVPAHAHEAAEHGADIYAVSALYTVNEQRRLDIHCAARAMDYRMYTLLANCAGTGPDWQSCGGSGVWHPDGRRSIQAGTAPELVLATLSWAELQAHRTRDAHAGYPRGAGNGVEECPASADAVAP
jgi:predicted amidohydrolase